MGIYNYTCNASMSSSKKVFSNADGDFLVVPQTGTLFVRSEMGNMLVKPTEICVLPRGVKFSVDVSESSRGYVLEIFKVQPPIITSNKMSLSPI